MSDAAPPSLFEYFDLAFPPAREAGALVEYYLSPHQKLYGLNVYFVGDAPPAPDSVLRECAALAAAHRGDHNIHVSAYLLPSADTDFNQRKSLSLYGRDFFLCFDAQLRQIGVRRAGGKRFVDRWAIADVAVVGSTPHGRGAEPLHPLDDDAGMDDEVDDPTDDMRGTVREWIWYGYDAPGDIDRWIDENAAAGDGFDVEWIKAFAAALLARKRAAEATWPEETDCDRLDRAFDALNEQGICALQCAGNTLDDGFEAVGNVINADDVPEDRYTGYCFFHSQDLDRALYGAGLMLAFGHLDSEDAADFVAVGRKVCEVLAQHGLQTEWNGSDNSRINLPGLRWQRRTPT